MYGTGMNFVEQQTEDPMTGETVIILTNALDHSHIAVIRRSEEGVRLDISGMRFDFDVPATAITFAYGFVIALRSKAWKQTAKRDAKMWAKGYSDAKMGR